MLHAWESWVIYPCHLRILVILPSYPRHPINHMTPQFSSVQFSQSVMSDSLQPHGLQHARFPYPPPTPGACSNSCPSHWWCRSTIASSDFPFSSFNLSQHQGLFQWVSYLHQVTKVLEFQLEHQSFQWIYIQNWFPLGLTGLISLQSKWLKSLLQHQIQKHQFFSTQFSL